MHKDGGRASCLYRISYVRSPKANVKPIFIGPLLRAPTETGKNELLRMPVIKNITIVIFLMKAKFLPKM